MTFVYFCAWINYTVYHLQSKSSSKKEKLFSELYFTIMFIISLLLIAKVSIVDVFKSLKVFSDMLISMSEDNSPNSIKKEELANDAIIGDNNTVYNSGSIDYSRYLGVLEIPKIGLKRGFYGLGSKYNNIKYNVTMVSGTSLPDQVNGNTILMAHSGDAYISFFAYLYKLRVGDYAYITYKGNKYAYHVVNIYNVPKVGVVSIRRNNLKTCLTLITCTKNSKTEQTIYILERD